MSDDFMVSSPLNEYKRLIERWRMMRTLSSIMRTKARRRRASIWKTNTTRPNVGFSEELEVYADETAKKGENPDAAIAEFQQVVEMEEQKGDWLVPCLILADLICRGFKALKQSVKVSFSRGNLSKVGLSIGTC